MKSTPKWLKDLQKDVDSVKYGDIEPKIKKVGDHVVQVEVANIETLRYDDTKAALDDFHQMVVDLAQSQMTGLLHVVFEFKDGTIQTVGYKNKKTTRY